MKNGYMGQVLKVDLSNGEVTNEGLTEEILKTWLGGFGLGAKYLFEEVPPQVKWNHPDNRVMLMSGPLGGTSVSGSGTICACTKGALTEGTASTQANGYLGAYLKFCGYDGLVAHGASKEWVYLHIDDDGASLRDARNLVGLDTQETQTAIHEELGTKRTAFSVLDRQAKIWSGSRLWWEKKAM